MDMVTLVECNQMDVDRGSSSSGGLPMTSEDTGLWPVASPLAGCLGKVQERAASLDVCPWCAAKGLNYALRSFNINLHQSLRLCTNPPCLFPLVSRPLEDVLSSLVPAALANKRRLPDDGAVINSPTKRPHLGELGIQSNGASGLAERCCVVDIQVKVQDAAPDDKTLNGHDGVSLRPETREGESPRVFDNGEEMETDAGSAPLSCLDFAGPGSSDASSAADRRDSLPVSEAVDDPRRVPGHPEAPDTPCNLTSDPLEPSGASQQLSEPRAGDETPLAGRDADADVRSETKDSSPTASLRGSEERVPVPTLLFWKNTDNMCWLDALLAAVVNCRSLRRRRPADEPRRSAVWRLMRRYEEICAGVRAHQHTGKDDVATAPDHVLQKANADLHSLRMAVFEQLQPKLRCTLGQRETPVFALPLLLGLDSWAEPVFQSTFQWEFTCTQCSAASLEQFTKTLPTCTNLLPEWSPLNAVHLAPCNVCGKRSQERRTMILGRVPPVFVLHFVDGLPNKDLTRYSFSFEGRPYSITTVIQYDRRRRHFVTWIHRPDGSWLELDDLKHPHSKSHRQLPVPAQEMHMVFWEVEQDQGSGSDRSPLRTLCSPDRSLLRTPGDIIRALSPSEDAADLTVMADTSIGSTTLLETFEGLSHEDIVTLTLVEVNPDSTAAPANDASRKDTLDASPDSSSAALPHETSDDPAPSSESRVEPAPESSSSLSAAIVPSAAKKVRGKRVSRCKAAGRQSDTRAAPEPEVDPARGETAPGESSRLKPTSPPAAPSCTAKAAPPSQDLKARMKILMDMYPLKAKKVQEKYNPTTFTPVLPLHLKPALPPQAPPTTQQQQQPPRIPSQPSVKAQLRTEESDGLPPKAAEMYHGFGIKSPIPVSPPAGHAGKHAGNTQLPPPLLTKDSVASSRKHGSSKVPPGLSDTDALRYRLLKKLKAKKKKLAKLNQTLGLLDGASLQPDSTNLPSPGGVTSSTYGTAASDLLSPATTASNLSPDSTDFLSLLASGPDGGGLAECVGGGGGDTAPQMYVHQTNQDNFMEEFISQAVADGPMEMGGEDLSELDFFM